MVKYSFLALAAVAMAPSSVEAFAPQSTSRAVGTSLKAFAPPTLIIGPMIRKMREDQEKKKKPMASDQERAYEAPGLRVGSGAWKWPPVWPYEESFFTVKEDLIAQKAPDMNGMAGLLNQGMTELNGAPKTLPVSSVDVKTTFDALKYWEEEKANVATEMDPEAVKNLKK
jgi:hypothetical protein